MKICNRKWLVLLPIGVMSAGAMTLAILNRGIEAQTSPDNADARLKSRRYKAALEDVRGSTLEAIPRLRKYGARWRTIDDGAENIIVAEVPVLVFTDELIITLREENGFTRVDVHSKSRFPGRSDLGENRRHILQLLAALDEKFA